MKKKKYTSKELKNRNRSGRKLKAEIKALRPLIAKNSNEIYLRKQRRKGTSKKKKILKRRKGTSKKKKIRRQWIRQN